jgi:hypothetical protein
MIKKVLIVSLLVASSIYISLPITAQETEVSSLDDKVLGMKILNKRNRIIFHNGSNCVKQCFDNCETACNYALGLKVQC